MKNLLFTSVFSFFLFFSYSEGAFRNHPLKEERKQEIDFLFEKVRLSCKSDLPLNSLRYESLALHSAFIKSYFPLYTLILFERLEEVLDGYSPEFFHLRHAPFWLFFIILKYIIKCQTDTSKDCEVFDRFFIKKFGISSLKLKKVENEILSYLKWHPSGLAIILEDQSDAIFEVFGDKPNSYQK